MYIERATGATEELFSALQYLIPQLGIHKIPPSRNDLTALVNSKSSILLLARYPDETGEIAGLLTLIIYRVPTGIRSIVEDIVVDEKFRRQGIARALLNHAIRLARDAGAGNLSLTSVPDREAANKLYEKMGFQRRQTNPYIYYLNK